MIPTIKNNSVLSNSTLFISVFFSANPTKKESELNSKTLTVLLIDPFPRKTVSNDKASPKKNMNKNHLSYQSNFILPLIANENIINKAIIL